MLPVMVQSYPGEATVGRDDASEPAESQGATPAPWSVSGLNRAVRAGLEQSFGEVRVVGECADVAQAASGHVYFTLCDEAKPAQIRCVMFRRDVQRSPAKLAIGARVELVGGLSLYEARGSFQLIARLALPAGLGELAARFEALKRTLEAEGLFAQERKRPLPRVPRRVGVVTSQAGAALHDVIRVMDGRFPSPLVVADCRVQGEDAPRTILAALNRLIARGECDVIIVTRGGGSAEDLWAFNDAAVVRAIAASPVPIVSGVGHEVDVTLSDLAADVRAATPSNAAELVFPERAALRALLEGAERRMQQHLDARIGGARLQLERRLRRLALPKALLEVPRRRVDAQTRRLEQVLGQRLAEQRERLVRQSETLRDLDPRRNLLRLGARLQASTASLHRVGPRLVHDRRQHLLDAERRQRASIATFVERRRHRLEGLIGRLDALSPLKVLSRGYAIALSAKSGRALRDAAEVRPGDRFTLRLGQGTVEASVLSPREAAQASLELD